MDSANLIVVKNLQKHFPIKRGFLRRTIGYVKAVDGVDLAVRKGEILGLVGESGCGKSTIARCLVRLEEPTQGEVYFENQAVLLYDHKKMKRFRRDAQIIFQDPYSSLNPRKTAGQLIGEPFVIHGVLSGRDRQERVRSLMDIVGLLPEQVNRYPHEFSGGQRQRICVARALALKPKLVIADEPVSALDVSIQAQILNLLVQLQRDFDLTYLFISHNLSVVRHISERVAVMYLGRIVELATNESFYNHPIHPYTKALLSAVPIPNPLRKKEKILLEGDVPSPISIPSGCSFHPRCRYHQDICTQAIPAMEEIEAEHWVTCHFARSKAMNNCAEASGITGSRGRQAGTGIP